MLVGLFDTKVVEPGWGITNAGAVSNMTSWYIHTGHFQFGVDLARDFSDRYARPNRPDSDVQSVTKFSEGAMDFRRRNAEPLRVHTYHVVALIRGAHFDLKQVTGFQYSIRRGTVRCGQCARARGQRWHNRRYFSSRVHHGLQRAPEYLLLAHTWPECSEGSLKGGVERECRLPNVLDLCRRFAKTQLGDQVAPRGRVGNAGRGEVVDALEVHQRPAKENPGDADAPLRLDARGQLRVLPGERATRRLRRVTGGRARCEGHGQVIEFGQELLFPDRARRDQRASRTHRRETAGGRARHARRQVNRVDGGRLE